MEHLDNFGKMIPTGGGKEISTPKNYPHKEDTSTITLSNLPNGQRLNRAIADGEVDYFDLFGDLRLPQFSGPLSIFDKEGSLIKEDPKRIKFITEITKMDDEKLFSGWGEVNGDSVEFSFSKDENNHTHLFLFSDKKLQSVVNFRDFGFSYFVFNYIILFYFPEKKVFLVYDYLQDLFYEWDQVEKKNFGMYTFTMKDSPFYNFECLENTEYSFRQFIKYYSLPKSLPRNQFRKEGFRRKEVKLFCQSHKLHYHYDSDDTSNLTDQDIEKEIDNCDRCWGCEEIRQLGRRREDYYDSLRRKKRGSDISVNQKPNDLMSFYESNSGKQLDLFKQTTPDNDKLKYVCGFSPVDEERIVRELEDFIDEGYDVKIDYGMWDENKKIPDHRSWFVENIIFKPFRPCVQVRIRKTEETSDADLTLRLKAFHNRMKNNFESIFFFQNQYSLSTRSFISDIKVEEGHFFDTEKEKISETLTIAMIWFHKITLTEKQIWQYLDREPAHITQFTDGLRSRRLYQDITFDENGVALIELDASWLFKYCCITSPLYEENEWMIEFITEENPDFPIQDFGFSDMSVFYDLNDENIKLLIEKFVEPEFKQLKRKYSFLSKFRNVQELINSVIPTKDDSLIKNLGYLLSRESENEFDDIRSLYNEMGSDNFNFETQATIMKSFEECVEKNLQTKIVSQRFHSGLRKVTILAKSDWLNENDLSEEKIDLEDIMISYARALSGTRYGARFKPILPRYGDVNQEEFNKEVTEILKK